MKFITKKLGFYLFIMVVLLIPNVVLAEGPVDVKIRTGSFSSDGVIVATIEGDKSVTTIGEIKQILVNEYNIDFNNYILADTNFNEYNDSTVICNGQISCFGPIDRPMTYLELIEIDDTKKEFIFDSIPATDEMMFYNIFETNYELFDGLNYKTCNDSYTKCTFSDYKTHKVYNNVVIKYNYDINIQELAKAVVDAGLLNKSKFTLTDTELLHYINYGGVLADYSSEFKNQLSYLNFKFEMDARGGAFDPFETAQIGFYKFLYDNKLYAVKDFMEVSARHIIYVPTDTTNIKKAIVDRLNTIFGNSNHITVTESDETINDYLTREGLDTIENGNQHYYILVSSNENSDTQDMEFAFIAIKDSSKINNEVSFRSSDLTTNVSVMTDSLIPLDTLLKVLGITSGKEYDKIMNLLKISDAEMFDISLYSSSQDKYIKKLDNGKFIVSIPVPKKFEGKSLIAYYVDENDNIKTYNVTVKDGYASFETDHFSVYTLAEDLSVSKNDNTTSNPQTADKIMLYFTMLGLSIVSLIVIVVCTRMRKLN